MLRLVATRLVSTIALLIGLSLIVFTLMYLAPGSLELTLIGNRRVTPEAVAAIREAYHLDDPAHVRYLRWLGSVLRGDLGTSVRTGSPVSTMIGERIGYTLLLAAMAAAISTSIGIPAGILAARHRGSAMDRLLVGVSVIAVSAPAFAVALLLLYTFGYRFAWFPIYGTGDGFFDVVWHLTLPAIALSTGLTAMTIKITRAAVGRELDQDYVTFARSRGLEPSAIRRLYLGNAALPVLTSVGLTLTYLVGGAVITEVTFGFPGLGSMLVDSISFQDLPAVQAVTLLVAVLVVVVTLLVDIAHTLADPQLRRRATR